MDILVKIYKELPPVDIGEVYRYMRMPGRQESDARIADTVRECISELCGGGVSDAGQPAAGQPALRCGVCYADTEITRADGKTDLGFAVAESRDLDTCLRGCSRAVVFAATIGGHIDRLIAKYSRFSPVRALALQALGAERVEALCDMFCRELKTHYASLGCDIRPRYSPGYGDLPLEFQKEVFRLLDPPRRIGVCLGESLLMTPSKSVTAIVGVTGGEKPQS